MVSPISTSIESVLGPADRLYTLPRWRWDPLDPAAPRTLGFEAARWIEGRGKYPGLIQPNGPRARQPFRLTLDQLTFLLWWYALDDQAQWMFHHAVRRLAKGSGKSPFAAVLALLEFCGPIRLERFDDRVAGGSRGKAADMPLVQIAATAESQTANTMRMVRALAPKGSKVVEAYGLDPGKTQYYKLPEGTLEVITSSATAAEGAEGSFTVADETEHWRPSNGGIELAATLQDNLAKSGARMLETSNAWVPGAESVAEKSWDAWVAQEEGLTRGETRILYDARIAPPDTDLSDSDSLRSALEWVYGDCDWKKPQPSLPPDVRPIMKRIWAKTARVDDSKRKYLNWPTAAHDAWVLPEQWSRMADPSIVVAEGEEIVAFFDGSKSRDATALVCCRLSDGHVFTIGVWEPNPAHDSAETVDVDDVDRAVRIMFSTYKVVAYFGDVKEWESFVLTEWPRRHGDDIEVWAVPSGKPPQKIAWDMRSHKDEFAKAAEVCESEIRDGAFTQDGHPATSRHVANARRRPYKDMVSVGKESPDSPKKIDAAVCVIGVRMVRRLVLATGARKKKRTGKVW